jgi:hypothetical protein
MEKMGIPRQKKGRTTRAGRERIGARIKPQKKEGEEEKRK